MDSLTKPSIKAKSLLGCVRQSIEKIKGKIIKWKSFNIYRILSLWFSRLIKVLCTVIINICIICHLVIYELVI